MIYLHKGDKEFMFCLICNLFHVGVHNWTSETGKESRSYLEGENAGNVLGNPCLSCISTESSQQIQVLMRRICSSNVLFF